MLKGERSHCIQMKIIDRSLQLPKDKREVERKRRHCWEAETLIKENNNFQSFVLSLERATSVFCLAGVNAGSGSNGDGDASGLQEIWSPRWVIVDRNRSNKKISRLISQYLKSSHTRSTQRLCSMRVMGV
ncbi:hypothetical protein POX_h09566 [Penicillium oxalicum]|uniref:hypothetical protein n=1 Tax=Penicillium oxalicum TaxID=69781 RepID=UPI0020B7FCC9|nr:hypothetical protein POX_h09566 [Penicillium oxalicum]KAI2785806.1 hypothetical protein POX_h09566 [Penicillium oxalicum]